MWLSHIIPSPWCIYELFACLGVYMLQCMQMHDHATSSNMWLLQLCSIGGNMVVQGIGSRPTLHLGRVGSSSICI